MVDEKIAALNKKHVETALQAAQMVFDSIEKLTRLNIEAAKMLFQEGMAGAATLASVTDVEQLNKWRDDQARASAGRFLGTRTTSTRSHSALKPISANCWNRVCLNQDRKHATGLRWR